MWWQIGSHYFHLIIHAKLERSFYNILHSYLGLWMQANTKTTLISKYPREKEIEWWWLVFIIICYVHINSSSSSSLSLSLSLSSSSLHSLAYVYSRWMGYKDRHCFHCTCTPINTSQSSRSDRSCAANDEAWFWVYSTSSFSGKEEDGGREWAEEGRESQRRWISGKMVGVWWGSSS